MNNEPNPIAVVSAGTEVRPDMNSAERALNAATASPDGKWHIPPMNEADYAALIWAVYECMKKTAA